MGRRWCWARSGSSWMPWSAAAVPLKKPDDIARLYWGLHTGREPAERLICA